MATIRQRKLKNGNNVYDIQVKVKDPQLRKVIIKTTTWKPDERMTERQEMRSCEVFAQKYEDEIKSLYTCSTGEAYDYDITFAGCAEKWLERIKTDFSLGYYEMNLAIVEWADRYLGNYKMREITPFMIQTFYDKLDAEKRIKITVHAKPALREVMKKKGIAYKHFRYDYKLNSGSLAHALAGENVSLVYAKSMADILGVNVEEVFYVEKTEQLYSPSTTSKVKRATRCIFALAKRQRIVEHNYASAEYISYSRKPQKHINCLDDTEAKQLYKAVMDYKDIRAKTAILLLLMTGMRRGELAGLEWKDIDFENRRISINRASAFSKTKGIYTKAPKTEGSIRRISVSEVVIKQLEEYYEWYKATKQNWGDRWVDTDRLFVQEHGQAINPGTIRFWLQKLLKESGLPYVTVHSLRHTNITLQITAGVPLRTIAGRAGHSRTSTTTDIYSHFIITSDEMAADTLERIFTEEE